MSRVFKFGATAVALLVVLGVVAGLSVASAHDTDGEVASRDALITAQEDLLNTYRCMFSIDMQLVPGGCDPDRVPGLVPELGLFGTGASLGAGRYQIDISVEGADDFDHFSVNAHGTDGSCDLLANELVDTSWSGSVVLTVSTDRFHFGCKPGDLLIEVDAPAQADWQITFTGR